MRLSVLDQSPIPEGLTGVEALRNTLDLVPPPEKAIAYLSSIGEPVSGSLPDWRRGIIGSPQTVAPRLQEVADEYGAEEVIVVTITHEHQARRRSYELLAAAFDLTARAPDLTTGAATAFVEA
ncbi:MAG: hypothetical protein ACRDKL_04115 [Solirubrobacteraceae bacterium]